MNELRKYVEDILRGRRPRGPVARDVTIEAPVDLGDQTAEVIPLGAISTAILTYFYLVLGTNLRIFD